jgi:transcription initiation factor TFIID subunit 2
MAPMDTDGEGAEGGASVEFVVTHQEVELDIDFAKQQLTGTTSLTIQPLVKALKYIPLNCRQIQVKSVQIEGQAAQSVQYDDPYDRLTARPEYGVQQHHLIQESFETTFRYSPEGELLITLPPRLKIKELSAAERLSARTQDAETVGALEIQVPGSLDDGGPKFKTITVKVSYTVKSSRDALHWVGLADCDQRYPHVYTLHQSLPGDTACFIFPCVDALSSRPTWRFILSCPRTLGDIAEKVSPIANGGAKSGRTSQTLTNGEVHSNPQHGTDGRLISSLTEDEKALEMAVVCSGYMDDSDAPGEADRSKRRWIFSCSNSVSAHHVGFALGPFEQADLSGYRESDQDDKLGDHAVRLHAFCLPGRLDEVQNVCQPLAMALDHFTVHYGSYPFEAEATSHKLVFVDDLVEKVIDTATLSICSSRLLFPPEILDGMVEKLRELVHAIASQWLGVNIVPRTPYDFWVVTGGSYFMADSFLQTLCGRNEHRFRQKMASEKVFDLDVGRPSIHALGPYIGLDPSNLDFIALKAPLVLFILDQRIIKGSGRNGVNRIFWRLLLDTKVGKVPGHDVSTEHFMRICEKVGHIKLDAFFQQWVYGAGCPLFYIGQKFNKKKLVIEMVIVQRQSDGEFLKTSPLTPDNFMREVKEHEDNVWASELQHVFTGPMTIRIHEADGTPYEHIVDIKDKVTRFEIPYNTKYKRLKRSRRQKERQANAVGMDVSGEPTDDVLLYCLGDVLQDSEDMNAWQLVEWSREDEEKMEGGFFEWIRVDKDFEWICKTRLNQEPYMFVSQLQQDNDVVAQVESLRFLETVRKAPIVSTVLVRTLMDARYFHGIRVMAADVLARCVGVDEGGGNLELLGLFHLEKAFQELYCMPDSPMTRSNDFSDRASYIIQCAIPKAIAKVRDAQGRPLDRVRNFFIDKLKFNDNTNNEFSDSFYIATLMSCLTGTLIAENKKVTFEFVDYDREAAEARFRKKALSEIDRYRRIDEWIPSYQNVFTVTALDCLALLMRERVIPRKLSEFMQYTRPENANTVRLKAFSCLVDLGVLDNPALMRYIIRSFAAEISPYVRSNLWLQIGRGLGMVATTMPETQIQPETNGLTIEGADKETQREALAKTQNVEGAAQWLHTRLKDNSLLQEALLDALRSPFIGHKNFSDLLRVCRILYDPVDSFIFKSKLPVYYAVERGNERALLRFYPNGRYRTKPLPKLDLKKLKRAGPEAEESRAPSPDAKRRRISESPELKRRRTALASPALPPQQPDHLPVLAEAEPEVNSMPMPPPPPMVVPAAPIPKPAPTPKLSLQRKKSETTTPKTTASKKRLMVKLKFSDKEKFKEHLSRMRKFQQDSVSSIASPAPSAAAPAVKPPKPPRAPSISRNQTPVPGPPPLTGEPSGEKKPFKLKLKFGSK